MMDIDRWNPGGSRFNTKAPADGRSLRAKINDIKTFLGSESSTKQGIRDVYERRLESLNENNDTNFRIDDLMDLFDSALWKKFEGQKITSDEILKAIGYIKDHATSDEAFEVLKEQANMKGKVPQFVEDNPFQNELIRKMLQDTDSVNAMYQYFKKMK